jgi:transcriptional regulatory protein RtcR
VQWDAFIHSGLKFYILLARTLYNNIVKKIVVLGFVGTQLDAGHSPARWEKWRPTVSLSQHPDLAIARMELFFSARPDRYREQLAQTIKNDISNASPETEVNFTELPIQDPWDFGEVYAALFDFAQRYDFKPDEEDYWVHITTGTHVAQICLFLLTEARFIPGVLLQTSPPTRKVPGLGGAGVYALIDLDLSKYDQLATRFAIEEANAVSFLKSGIATQNARFNKLIEEIERVSVRSRSPMLLMGPTGAGKSFLAKRIYELKRTRQQFSGGFVEVNCATLHGDGAASALFGHVRGAFTGATSDRAGLLRTANKGLLFLDEIGELGVDEQAMLLKAIEEKKFFPVGGDKEVESDFQLIAGTNRDLREEVAAGRFREDLFARINLWTYQLPSLAERIEDIAPNLDFSLQQYSHEHGRMVRFSREARVKYMAFAQSADAAWRGNFRDLSASVSRMATLAEGGRISEAVVDDEVARLRQAWARFGADNQVTTPQLATLMSADSIAELDLFDRMQLESVIQVCARAKSLSAAGRELFASSRVARASTNDADRLRKYLARFGLTWAMLAGK